MNVKCPKCSHVNVFNRVFIPYYICKHCQFGEMLYRIFQHDSKYNFNKAYTDYHNAFVRIVSDLEVEEMIKGVL